MKKILAVLLLSILCWSIGSVKAQKVLLSFNDTNGVGPYGEVTIVGNVMYGIAELNIFSIHKDGSEFRNLYTFAVGADPQGSLTLVGTKFYAMTSFGGINGDGNIFSIDTNGKNYKDLLDFNYTNGYDPWNNLTYSSGVLYGTTLAGGTNGDGTVFSIDTNGANYKQLHGFNGTDGGSLFGGLALSGNVLYGTVSGGAAHNKGCIFSIHTDGTGYTDLFDFNDTNGAYSYCTPTLKGKVLYGTAYRGGTHDAGVIFSIDTNGNNFKDIFSFDSANGYRIWGDLTPVGNIFYGMTWSGGTYGRGTIYSIDTSGNLFTHLVDFNDTNGASPFNDLTYSSGILYGMTGAGGKYDQGTVFKYYPFAVSLNTIPISCNGSKDGKLSALALEGAPPYTYKWAPGGQTTGTISGLSAGTYSVTVTDSTAASVSTSITLTQPLVLTATMGTPDNVLCNGSVGSANVIVGGGTSAYTYLWSPSGGTRDTGTGLTAGLYKISVTDYHGCKATASVTITQPTVLTATIGAPNNILCNGGVDSAIASAGGGVSPYTYLWSNKQSTSAISNLSAGTYTITITDHNGCTGTASATITQPNALVVSANTTANERCKGYSYGAITATVSGGTSPYTYLWVNGQSTSAISNLSAGTYTITITDHNGCTGTASATITQPNALVVSAHTTANEKCNGGNNGAITSTVSGGTSPYTYLWVNGQSTSAISNLYAGIYALLVTDYQGCTDTTSATITQPVVLAVNAIVTTEVSCNGESSGSASSVASGGTSPYTYNWSGGHGNKPNAGNLTAGSYTVTVNDSCGGLVVAIVNITQPTDMVITRDSTADNGSSNGSVTANVVGGTVPYTYSWAPGGQTAAAATGLSAGSYCCTITDNNDCSKTVCITVNSTAGVSELKGESGIVRVYPNPGNGVFTVTFSHPELVSGSQTIEVYNTLGEKIYYATLNQVQGTINLSSQPNGIYLYRVITETGDLVGEGKLVIQK